MIQPSLQHPQHNETKEMLKRSKTCRQNLSLLDRSCNQFQSVSLPMQVGAGSMFGGGLGSNPSSRGADGSLASPQYFIAGGLAWGCLK